MNNEILTYIRSQRVGVVALEMPDGSPHAATLHFAIMENPLTFLFVTNRDTRKSESLLRKEKTRASMVIGSDESHMKTLQMDGIARLATPSEQEELFKKIYLGKFPEKKIDPESAPFLFIPTWWRFTDWTKPEGKWRVESAG